MMRGATGRITTHGSIAAPNLRRGARLIFSDEVDHFSGGLVPAGHCLRSRAVGRGIPDELDLHPHAGRGPFAAMADDAGRWQVIAWLPEVERWLPIAVGLDADRAERLAAALEGVA